MTFNSAQVNAISIIPCVSGSLSVIGSLSIIYCICSDWKTKISKIYYRLLLPFSIFDVIFSFTVALGSLPAPEGSHNASWANGNTSTCTAQGFLNAVGYAATYYSASLSISYLLSISFSKSEGWIKKHVERYLHVIPIAVGIVPAIAGLPLEVFNWAGNKCYIAAHPLGCDYTDGLECTRGVGENTILFRWLAQGMWVMLAFIIVGLSMIMIVWRVWKLERRINERFNSAFNTSRSSESEGYALGQDMQRTRQIAMQALCYIMSFFVTWVWTYIDRTCMYETGERPFVFLVLGQFFYPLQGFWNALIFHYRLIKAKRRSARLTASIQFKSRISREGNSKQGSNTSESRSDMNLTDVNAHDYDGTESGNSQSSKSSSGTTSPDNKEASDLEGQYCSGTISQETSWHDNTSPM